MRHWLTLSIQTLGDGSRHIVSPSCEVIDYRGDGKLDKLYQCPCVWFLEVDC